MLKWLMLEYIDKEIRSLGIYQGSKSDATLKASALAKGKDYKVFEDLTELKSWLNKLEIKENQDQIICKIIRLNKVLDQWAMFCVDANKGQIWLLGIASGSKLDAMNFAVSRMKGTHYNVIHLDNFRQDLIDWLISIHVDQDYLNKTIIEMMGKLNEYLY